VGDRASRPEAEGKLESNYEILSVESATPETDRWSRAVSLRIKTKRIDLVVVGPTWQTVIIRTCERRTDLAPKIENFQIDDVTERGLVEDSFKYNPTQGGCLRDSQT
jgi:hypothetical protein